LFYLLLGASELYFVVGDFVDVLVYFLFVSGCVFGEVVDYLMGFGYELFEIFDFCLKLVDADEFAVHFLFQLLPLLEDSQFFFFNYLQHVLLLTLNVCEGAILVVHLLVQLLFYAVQLVLKLLDLFAGGVLFVLQLLLQTADGAFPLVQVFLDGPDLCLQNRILCRQLVDLPLGVHDFLTEMFALVVQHSNLLLFGSSQRLLSISRVAIASSLGFTLIIDPFALPLNFPRRPVFALPLCAIIELAHGAAEVALKKVGGRLVVWITHLLGFIIYR
jgi:hypothetical protein